MKHNRIRRSLYIPVRIAFPLVAALLLAVLVTLAACDVTSGPNDAQTEAPDVTQTESLTTDESTTADGATDATDTTAKPDDENTSFESESDGGVEITLPSDGTDATSDVTGEGTQVTEPDGTTAKPDDATIEPDGTTAKPDETTAELDETTTESDDIFTEPDVYNVDFPSMSDQSSYKPNFTDAGYYGPIFLLGYAEYIDLGHMDLSMYDKVLIHYGCDGGLGTEAAFAALNGNLPIGLKSTATSYGQAGSYDMEGDLAHANMFFNPNSWANGARWVEIDLTDVDYEGNVYLALHNPAGTLIAISAIEFVFAEGTQTETTQPEETTTQPEETTTQPEETTTQPEETTTQPEETTTQPEETTTQPEETTTQPEETTTPEPEESTEIELDTEAGPVNKHPGNSALYDGVLISSVHGTGKKGLDAMVSHSFVQLYNSSSRAISLAGASLYYKTNDASPYVQFTFPADAVIPAGGYYLVRGNAPTQAVADNILVSITNYDAEWDVYLDNKEVRILLAPSGWMIGIDENITAFTDAISVFYASELNAPDSVYAIDNLSRSKIAVRTALKKYSGYHIVNLSKSATDEIKQASPVNSKGQTNAVLGSMINEVLFSKPAGIYASGFRLELSAASGYTIYYTTDGSDPTNPANAARKKYTSSVSLTITSSMAWGQTTNMWGRNPSVSKQVGGHVIKAYATNGTTATPVFTNTYFITNKLDYGVSIMSISMPADKIVGTNGFYSNYNPTGVITDTRPRGLAVMEVFDENGKRVGHSNVELAVSGNGSSGFGMKSLRVYYKNSNNLEGGMDDDLDYDLFRGLAKDADGNPITSFSRLLLRNSGNDCGHSYIRDAYMQRVSAGLNIDTMASASVLVFINGEFWGVYNARERYSPEYVEDHYGVDKDNVAVLENDYWALVSEGSQTAPFLVSSGIEGDQDSFNALTEYIIQNNLSSASAYQFVCSQMDIDSFIDMWVIRMFFNARDWPENNIKVWRNRNADDPSGFDTKWHFTLLDTDMGIAYYEAGHWADTSENMDYMSAFMNSGSTIGQMMRSLLKNETFKNKFITRYYQVVTEHFSEARLSAIFEEMYAERNPLMSLQAGRWACDGASVSTWESDVADMRSFIANRRNTALNSLYSYFGINENTILNMIEPRITLNVHDSRASVTVNGKNAQNGYVLKITGNSLKVTVNATAKAGYVVTGIAFTDANGVTRMVEGTTASWTLSTAGTITVYTQRESTPDSFANGKLVAGATYMFFLSGDGDLYAWGDNRHGALGLGTSGGVITTPTLVMTGVAKVATSAGNDYENGTSLFSTAILTTDGRVLTVGRNSSGQLGRNGMTDSYQLAEISFKGKVKDISMGHDHLLIVDESGNLWGIGANNYGALGPNGQGSSVTTFQKIASNVVSASAGRRSTVYIGTDGVLYGLGDNRWKKLSQSLGDVVSTPVALIQNAEFVDSGEHQVLAVDDYGNLYYAGWRTFDSFHQGSGNNPTVRRVMGGVVKADVYFANMVVLDENGIAYVYGLNQNNGLGASAVTGGKPKKILDGVVDVAAGYGFTAYLMEDGTILVQGDNSFGQAGNGTTSTVVNLTEVVF